MIKNTILIMILGAYVFSLTFALQPAKSLAAEEISVDQICESNMDEPISGDDLYKDKTVKTTIKANMTRKIHSLCSDAPQGTFTVEFVTKDERVVQCFCNAPDQQSILDTPKGSEVSIQGTFKSMTASYFDSESKQCTITIQGCTFN